MSFPSSPINGQTAVLNNITYVFNSTYQSWTRQVSTPTTVANFTVTNGTASTSTSTGALIVTGGAGIGGNVYAGNVYTSGLYWASNGAVISGTYGNADVASYLPVNPTIIGINANVSGANVNISNLQANIGGYYIWANANVAGLYNSILGANAAIVTANTTLKSYVDTQDSAITTAWTANAGAQQNQINSLVTNANANVAAYLVSTPITVGAITIPTTIGGNLTIVGNLVLQGSSTVIGSQDLTVSDSVINLHTFANLAPLTGNDGRDIGFKFHYYDSVLTSGDNLSFLGRRNDTGFLEWFTTGTEGVGNVFTGGVYGTIKTGNLVLANSTVSSSTTTGALVVAGGAGIGGSLYIANTGDVSANIGGLQNQINTTNANIGGYYTWANANVSGLYNSILGANANAVAQQTAINATNANIGGYYTWANANVGAIYNTVTTHTTWLGNLQANVYANANVASYLPSYTGNVGAGNILVTNGIFWSGNGASFSSGSSGSALTVKDEGTNLSTAVTSIDFVGTGVTATNVGSAITVTIPGGGGSYSGGAVTSNVFPNANLTINSGGPNNYWGTTWTGNLVANTITIGGNISGVGNLMTSNVIATTINAVTIGNTGAAIVGATVTASGVELLGNVGGLQNQILGANVNTAAYLTIYGGNVSVYGITSPATNSNVIMDPDGSGWVVFTAPTPVLISNTLTVSNVVTTSGVFWANGAAYGGGGSALTIQDEGTTLTAGATSFNFTGAFTANATGTAVTISLPYGILTTAASGWYLP
jgi:hypothetical protein